MNRDPAFEAIWRAELARQIALYHDDDSGSFDRLLERRLAVVGGGASWDCGAALTKAADLAACMLLETVRRTCTAGDAQHHLLLAATHAGLADFHIRQAMRSH